MTPTKPNEPTDRFAAGRAPFREARMLKLFVSCVLFSSASHASAQVACMGEKAGRCPSGSRHFPCSTSPDFAVAQMCPGGEGTYGKPEIHSGNRCGYHLFQISCKQQSSRGDLGRSLTNSAAPSEHIQLWDFGQCGDAPVARWKGYRNSHPSATILINYKVIARQGNQASEYSGSKTLKPGDSEQLICTYQPGDINNAFPTQRDLSLSGAVFR